MSLLVIQTLLLTLQESDFMRVKMTIYYNLIQLAFFSYLVKSSKKSGRKIVMGYLAKHDHESAKLFQAINFCGYVFQ